MSVIKGFFTLGFGLLVSGCCLLDLSHRGSCCGADGKSADSANTPEVLSSTQVQEVSATQLLASDLKKSLFSGLTIYFDPGSSEITAESDQQLSEISQWLKANPGNTLIVEGHVDASGAAKTNIALAQRRAEKVKSLITSKGIGKNELKAVGNGNSPTERKAVVRIDS